MLQYRSGDGGVASLGRAGCSLHVTSSPALPPELKGSVQSLGFSRLQHLAAGQLPIAIQRGCGLRAAGDGASVWMDGQRVRTSAYFLVKAWDI